MAANAALIRALRRALRAAADPAKAPAMQAYMKSEMPYFGVQAVPLRRAVKPVLAARPLASFEEWRDTLLAPWRGARHREERYAAIELVGYPAYRVFQTLDALPVYEEMIVSGAWWDLVDSLASHQIGELWGQYWPNAKTDFSKRPKISYFNARRSARGHFVVFVTARQWSVLSQKQNFAPESS